MDIARCLLQFGVEGSLINVEAKQPDVAFTLHTSPSMLVKVEASCRTEQNRTRTTLDARAMVHNAQGDIARCSKKQGGDFRIPIMTDGASIGMIAKNTLRDRTVNFTDSIAAAWEIPRKVPSLSMT